MCTSKLFSLMAFQKFLFIFKGTNFRFLNLWPFYIQARTLKFFHHFSVSLPSPAKNQKRLLQGGPALQRNQMALHFSLQSHIITRKLPLSVPSQVAAAPGPLLHLLTLALASKQNEADRWSIHLPQSHSGFPCKRLLIFLINFESSLRHFPFCSQFEPCSEVFSINVMVSFVEFFVCDGAFKRDSYSCLIQIPSLIVSFNPGMALIIDGDS